LLRHSNAESFLLLFHQYGLKEKTGFSLNSILDLIREKSQEFQSAKAETSKMGMIGTGIDAAMGLKFWGVRWPDKLTDRQKALT
jgi:hypothetical protein